MYRHIEDTEKAYQIIEKLISARTKHMRYRIGFHSTMFFYNNPDTTEGGYLIVTAIILTNGDIHYSIDITDEKAVIKSISNRESYGERELTDEQIDFILEHLAVLPEI